MATQTLPPAAKPAAVAWPAKARLVGWGLLVCWLVVLVGTVFLGLRTSTLTQFQRAVADGHVSQVSVAGGLSDAPGVTGSAGLTLYWRDGLLRYQASVMEARPVKAADGGTDLRVVPAGFVDRLTAAHTELEVVQLADQDRPTFNGSAFGFQMPAWLVMFAMGSGLATLFLLIAGPQPWRATRWSWFWLFGVFPPLGLVGYLVFGGSTGLAMPPPGSKRLTGGWAFLISMFAASVLGALADAYL